MQIWKSSDTPREVVILLFDAFSNHCLANAVEPLRAANTLARKQLYRWHFTSLSGGTVISSSGLPVQTEIPLSSHNVGDYLFVMPSYDFEKHATASCQRALRAAASKFKTIVAMDMGSWLLASSGLLDGRRATIHWDELVNFAERFPEVNVKDDRVVEDENILSCGGVTTTFELVLGLIQKHHGPILALEVSSLFMYGERPHSLEPRNTATKSEKIRLATAIMRRNIEAPLSIPQIVKRIGLTEKSFSSACLDAFGFGPRKLYKAIRLREARRLAEHTGMSVSEIANRCGYQNASAMARAYKEEFGQTLSEVRKSRGF